MKSKLENKKEKVSERSNRLDPNNKGNYTKKTIKKNGKIIPDDGFEHRTSKDTTDPA